MRKSSFKNISPRPEMAGIPSFPSINRDIWFFVFLSDMSYFHIFNFQNDGTIVTQLTDFRMQSQITRILILGEEELNQPKFQVFTNWILILFVDC